MMEPIEQPDRAQLEAYVHELTREFVVSWRRTLDLAICLGEALLALKQKIGHGNWLPWVESDFSLGERMARNFMDLARNRQEIADLPPATTVTAALAWLRERQAQPKALPDSTDPHDLPLLRFCQPDLPTPVIVSLILRVAFPDARDALDMTYGSGAFWDGSAHVHVTAHDADSSRAVDGVVDFTALPYKPGSFDVALFDPPHLADAGAESIMGQRFGTYRQADLPAAIRAGTREAWRVARLGIIVKIAEHVHGQEFVAERDWVRAALEGQPLYDIVHQTRTGALVDPRWEGQLSAYNNGSTYLVFRRDGQKHVRRQVSLVE